jgi:hypothetical protein
VCDSHLIILMLFLYKLTLFLTTQLLHSVIL